MKTEIILVLAAVQLAYGVINRINASEYARLPPLYRLDDFDGCLLAPGDKYCYFDGKILDGDSDLHTLVKEYSANLRTHFDHTLFHWGLCVTQTCRQYYGNSTVEDALDACINATLYESHQLQAKLVRNNIFCTDFGEEDPYDTSDYVVAAVFLTLLMLNIFGTGHDLFFRTNKGFLSRLLLCFSLRRNWKKLVMPSGEGPEPKLKSLKCLNGLKAMTTFLVILGHSPLTGFIAVGNPQYQEEIYHKVFFQVLLNGTLIVQTFFTISGFLLAYNILVTSEKRRVSWRTLPQGIFVRWLRLTPVYAVIIAFISTWLRHLSSGPLWKPVVNTEVLDCRRDWWLHLLYIDNYVDLSQCMPQSWYISGDMQLSIIGMAIFCLCQGPRSRKIAITIAFVIGLITPAAHTFFQNLHAVLIVSPEMAIHFFVEDLTFNNLYKRGHTNLVCYAMGLALGMLMYDLYGQEDTKDKKNHRLLFWAAFPVGLGLVMLGMIFYIDDYEIPLFVRVVYSSAIKMCFGACICGIIAGTLMKLDSVFRGILEWQGWTAISRVSYCAYLIHICVIRCSLADYTSLQHISFYYITLNYCSVVCVTFMLSAPCWLLVESPVAQLIKLCLDRGNRTKPDINIKAAPPKWKDQEISNSVETVVVKTSL
ncbi:nose resistant to fluoxetine protein 6-like [Choristoneura fumiferana]|uniref:nose resistant to fluoxetine protein 6-like n=1 Tax=Choristoneura fumiferana TaxID=7141 RepID=UPI003D15799F